MRRTAPELATALALVWALACGGAGVRNDDDRASSEAAVARAAATITAADMELRITLLADDSMMGRDTPSPELEKTAAYIASEFERIGLEAAGDAGGWLQRYPLPLRALDTASVHFGTVDASGGEDRMLAYGEEFFASPAEAPEGAEMRHGALVWVGRPGESGLPAIGGSGKVPVVLLPGEFDREFAAAVSRARRDAAAAGATALVVALGPEFPSRAIGRFAELASRPRRVMPDPGEIAVYYLSRDAVRGIVERAGRALDDLPERPDRPIELAGVGAHFQADARTIDEANPPNVVGLLRGAGGPLADTYVILSAHMDHVGVGVASASGDSIYNGADDNASGTSAIVEVAEAFASLPDPPARSVVFLTVSGEEKGLLGSRWYSDHPTVPIDRIVANLNIDMIARNAPDSIVVIGQEYSSLGPLVHSVAADTALGLVVVDDPWPEERFFFRSDHFNFARKEIPALFFFAGVHDDYHRPSDEPDKIDADKAARVARLVFLTAHAIATSTEAPSWSAEGLAEVRARTR